MTALLNIHPFPLFITVDEMWNSPIWGGFHECLELGVSTVVPVTEFAASTDLDHLSQIVRLDSRAHTDALPTRHGLLLWEYSAEQRSVVLRVADKHRIRAADAAAFIAHRIFPKLGLLDSEGQPVTAAGKLPKYDGPNQQSFYGDFNFPFSVTPPTWFPQAGMPKLVFQRWG
ncbi:hypothetical protein HDC37_000800 [Microbacterium sp. AK009]|uniref:hypothetical protein n=1 Tax=Microbacterium sp. AK009 TaxID=2723068 RepID=UPI0015CA8B1C|nr:hypothetical protein [Microbacterium sp. AK009]NYF15986.1 hypothetical protein [Microbacterium sp. AK009]